VAWDAVRRRDDDAAILRADDLAGTAPTTLAGQLTLLVYLDAVMEDETSTVKDKAEDIASQSAAGRAPLA
jgi:hypothetical protein